MKKSLLIPSAAILIIMASLFYLTFQKPEDTVELSNRVAHLPVVSAFLERMGAYVSWSVRQWAHVFEFFIVGTGFSVLYIFITKHTWSMMAAALFTCMAVSFADVFWDGFLMDYYVQNRINEARNQITETEKRVKHILRGLTRKHTWGYVNDGM